MASEGVYRVARERNRSGAVPSFRGDVYRPAIRVGLAIQAAPDADCRGVQIDVVPCEREQLAEAEAGAKGGAQEGFAEASPVSAVDGGSGIKQGM